MQIHQKMSMSPVRFGTAPPTPEAIQKDLEKLLHEKSGLTPDNTTLYLVNNPTMVRIMGGPGIMVYGKPFHDDTADERIQSALANLNQEGVERTGPREFRYQNILVTVPAPRRLM